MSELEFIPPAKPIIGDDERAAVDRVMRSGMVAQGPEVAAFEQEFGAHMVAGRECVARVSPTANVADRGAHQAPDEQVDEDDDQQLSGEQELLHHDYSSPELKRSNRSTADPKVIVSLGDSTCSRTQPPMVLAMT